jgi:hypothetical protein
MKNKKSSPIIQYYNHLKNNVPISSNLQLFQSSNLPTSGQSTVEFVLFILLVTCVSFGMLKIFAVSWKHKFEFLSLSREILNALF